MVANVHTKYMTFELIEQKPKTTVWQVKNNQSGFLLGVISWYGAWRQYIYEPISGTLFNNGCLDTISKFLTDLNNEQRSSIRNK